MSTEEKKNLEGIELKDQEIEDVAGGGLGVDFQCADCGEKFRSSTGICIFCGSKHHIRIKLR